jgi:hypothetical protein
MMNSNVPNLITAKPSLDLFTSEASPEHFASFFPADMIAHPNIYDLELQGLLGINSGVLAIWETGRADNPDALNVLNTAVIKIAIERLRQQNKKA